MSGSSCSVSKSQSKMPLHPPAAAPEAHAVPGDPPSTGCPPERPAAPGMSHAQDRLTGTQPHSSNESATKGERQNEGGGTQKHKMGGRWLAVYRKL